MGETWTIVGMFDWQWAIAALVLLAVGAIVGVAVTLILRPQPNCLCQRDTVPCDVPRMPPRTRGASPLC